MSVTRLRGRVAAESAAVIAALAAIAATLGGTSAGLGLLAGGLLAVVSFWRLVSDAVRVSPVAASEPRARWLLLSGVRFLAVTLLLAALLQADWAHPVAVVAGLTVVPWVVIGQGLRLAREREG